MKVAIVFDLRLVEEEDILPDPLTEESAIKNVSEAFGRFSDDLSDNLWDINGWDFVDYEVRVLNE